MVSTIKNIPVMIQAMMTPAITPPLNRSDEGDDVTDGTIATQIMKQLQDWIKSY